LRVAVVAAVVAAAVAVAFAVSPARTAILRFFGVGAVRVEIVDRLPPVQPGPLDLGVPIDPDSAPFKLLQSSKLGAPDAVYQIGNVVTLLYGRLDRVRLLVTEISGSDFNSGEAKKLRTGGTKAYFVPLEGAIGPALWLVGEKHVVQVPGGGKPRLATNTLLWRRGALTLRLEGSLRLKDAIAIAESLR
jgi:hypothetical protein